MNGIDLFLIHYGLAAVFLIMLMKTMGVRTPSRVVCTSRAF